MRGRAGSSPPGTCKAGQSRAETRWPRSAARGDEDHSPMSNSADSPAPSSTTRRRRLPRALRITLLVAGALILLPIIALPIIAWAFDLGGVVRSQVMALKPGWEKQIGRGL